MLLYVFVMSKQSWNKATLTHNWMGAKQATLSRNFIMPRNWYSTFRTRSIAAQLVSRITCGLVLNLDLVREIETKSTSLSVTARIYNWNQNLREKKTRTKWTLRCLKAELCTCSLMSWSWFCFEKPGLTTKSIVFSFLSLLIIKLYTYS